MALWLVRAGRSGEYEDLALKSGRALISFYQVPDMSSVDSKDELFDILREAYPNHLKNAIFNFRGQLWAFLKRIQEGDLVILPLKTRSVIAIGKVIGPYEYKSDNPEGARHTRPVEWIRADIPRSALDQDLLYSIGAFMTVCQIQRNKAEERIRALVEGKPMPQLALPDSSEETVEEELNVPLDLEEYASDQIRSYIGRNFRGHELTRLATEVLKAQGYKVLMSPVGPDGGVDIIAGRGPMGFDQPRLCVQVKSSDSPVDVTVLRELKGVMDDFKADQGLLIAWGGFNQSVLNESRRRFFEIRLWDAGDLVNAVLENYDRLSKDLQAELPLKRIWALVLEE
ncbi:Restriction endonuclease [uncultured archaeon]|nr:Restriction endonuclease [uncultured archaeon]